MGREQIFFNGTYELNGTDIINRKPQYRQINIDGSVTKIDGKEIRISVQYYQSVLETRSQFQISHFKV